MWQWVLAAAALAAACSAESDPELLARGAEALRMLQRGLEKIPEPPAGGVGPRVWKGTIADPGMFPYAAFAAIFGRACSSTIIHPKFVLLVRLCTDNRPQDGVVMAGGTEFTTVQDLVPVEVQVRQIERWWVHPVDHEYFHDIAVARLFTVFVFGKFVGSLELPDKPRFGSSKKTCQMMGFGMAVPWDRQHILHYVKLEMQDFHMCQEAALAYGVPLGENAFCSIDTKTSSMCEGDNGGPVQCRGKLYGIISDKIPKGPKLIRECGETVLGNYFMYLGYYKLWIDSIVGEFSLDDIENETVATRDPIFRLPMGECEGKGEGEGEGRSAAHTPSALLCLPTATTATALLSLLPLHE